MSALLTVARSYEQVRPPSLSAADHEALLTRLRSQLLVQNATRISSIESSLRSLTWFLPGRFKDSELASEACECPVC